MAGGPALSKLFMIAPHSDRVVTCGLLCNYYRAKGPGGQLLSAVVVSFDKTHPNRVYPVCRVLDLGLGESTAQAWHLLSLIIFVSRSPDFVDKNHHHRVMILCTGNTSGNEVPRSRVGNLHVKCQAATPVNHSPGSGRWSAVPRCR